MTIYFLDRNLGRHKVAGALRGLGWAVEIHDDHFDQDAPDVEWIGDVSDRGWVVLTRDKRLRKNADEVALIRAARGRVFILGRADITADEAVERFRSHKRRIETIASEEPAPFVASVSKTEVRIERPPWPGNETYLP